MLTRRTLWQLLTSFLLVKPAFAAREELSPGAAPSPTCGPGMEMLTIFLRHDESKTLEEINEHLKSTGWYKSFPPAGVEVVSWYVLRASAKLSRCDSQQKSFET